MEIRRDKPLKKRPLSPITGLGRPRPRTGSGGRGHQGWGEASRAWPVERGRAGQSPEPPVLARGSGGARPWPSPSRRICLSPVNPSGSRRHPRFHRGIWGGGLRRRGPDGLSRGRERPAPPSVRGPSDPYLTFERERLILLKDELLVTDRGEDGLCPALPVESIETSGTCEVQCGKARTVR